VPAAACASEGNRLRYGRHRSEKGTGEPNHPAFMGAQFALPQCYTHRSFKQLYGYFGEPSGKWAREHQPLPDSVLSPTVPAPLALPGGTVKSAEEYRVTNPESDSPRLRSRGRALVWRPLGASTVQDRCGQNSPLEDYKSRKPLFSLSLARIRSLTSDHEPSPSHRLF
jgi:hypothetical protein